MEFLNTVDYSIIGLYFLVIIGISLYLRKRASKDLDSYFLGERNLPWWMLGVSGMASMVDMTGTMIAVSFIFMLGTRGLYIEGFRGAACLFLTVVLVFTGKYHRRSGCMTGADWMVFRFGDGFGGKFARLVMAISKITWAVGMTAYLVKGAGLFLSMFIPIQPWQCALIMVGIGTLYIMIAGFYGVVFADVFQSSIILSAVIVITTMAVTRVTGYTGFASLAAEITHNPDWMSSKLSVMATMPDGYKIYETMMIFAAFYLLKAVFNGMGMGDDPKYFGARSDRECGTLSFMWTWLMMFRWPLMMGFAVLGIFLVKDLFDTTQSISAATALIKANFGAIDKNVWVEYTTKVIRYPEQFPALVEGLKGIFGDAWAAKLPLVSFEGTVDPERIVPAVIVNMIPIGYRGFLLTALIAALVSTFGGTINMVTAFFTKDIYQAHIRPKAGNKELIYASWVFCVTIVGIGFIFGYYAKNINDIWGWVTMALIGGITAPLFLRFYWWRFNGGGFAIGTLCGMIGAVVLRLVKGKLEATAGLEWIADEKWYFCILLGIGLIGSILGTYMTRPTAKNVIENFYKKTLPIGFWGPMKNRLPVITRAKVEKEHFNDILALPFVILWMITLFMLPMQAIIGAWGYFKITAVIFVISLIGMYIFWYTKLPKKNYYEENEVQLND